MSIWSFPSAGRRMLEAPTPGLSRLRSGGADVVGERGRVSVHGTVGGAGAAEPGGPQVPTVFFLSDFGDGDGFAGIVRAVLHRLVPGIAVVDLAHGIAPFDVAGGARTLERAAPYLGDGVVLAVVDPGVGTERRGVAVRVGRSATGASTGFAGPGPAWLVGPDNGLLVPAARRLGRIDEVRDLPGVSTFDGRDVFAPAAAHLCVGGDPAAIGPPADPAGLVELVDPAERGPDGPAAPKPDGRGELRVPARWIDRFGNVQLDLEAGSESPWGGPWPDAFDVGVEPPVPGAPGRIRVRCVRGFGHLERGELGLLADADGRWALVLAEDSAADLLGVRPASVGTTRWVVLAPAGYDPR